MSPTAGPATDLLATAANGEPLAKRRKLLDDGPLTRALLYKAPRKHSVVDLYVPDIVRISAHHPDPLYPKASRMSFAVPRALLCKRSEYFDRVLNGPLVAASAIELAGVCPRIFRIFIGWLYCGSIFEERIDMDHPKYALPGTAEDGSQLRRTLPNGPACNNEQGEQPQGLGRMIAVRKEILAGTTRDADHHRERSSSLTLDADAEVVDTTQQQARQRDSDNSIIPPYDVEYDMDDPVTWPWRLLISLYVFADKHSTREFRMEILNIIQMKFMVKDPRPYQLPSYRDALPAVEDTAPTSPLYRFLADVYALHRMRHDQAGFLNIAENMSVLPSRFLAACLAALKRHYSARTCTKCLARTAHGDAEGHTVGDVKPVYERSPSLYHEHGKDKEEAARCALQWKSRKMVFAKLFGLEDEPKQRGGETAGGTNDGNKV